MRGESQGHMNAETGGERPVQIGGDYRYAAYVATWAIHIGYLSTLLRRYTRRKRETEEFNTRIAEKA